MILISGKEIEQNNFSAGELKLTLTPIKEDIPILIKWKYESDRELFTIACIRDFYKKNYCTLVVDYFPHARQDRVKNPEDVFTLKVFCKMLNDMNFDKVICLDVHSNVTPALVNNLQVDSPKAHIENVLTTIGTKNLTLFFPDEGAQKRYGEMFKNIPQAFGIKKRNWETQKIEDYMVVGMENIIGKRVLIIDDICSYGNTFIKAAESLKKIGTKEIYLYVSHCEDAISKGNVFTSGYFDGIFTTNSLIRSASTEEKLYHV